MAKTLPVDKGEGGQVVTDFVAIVGSQLGRHVARNGLPEALMFLIFCGWPPALMLTQTHRQQAFAINR